MAVQDSEFARIRNKVLNTETDLATTQGDLKDLTGVVASLAGGTASYGIETQGYIYTNIDSVNDIGAYGKRFKTIYAQSASIGNTLSISDTYPISVGNGNKINIKATLEPHSTNIYDLGSVSYRWNNVYINNIYLTGGFMEVSGTSTEPSKMFTMRRGQVCYMLIGTDNKSVIFGSDETNVPFVGTNSAHSFALRSSNTDRAYIDSVGNFFPATDNAYTLGKSGGRWSQVWAANGTIQTSDQKQKTDISSSDLGLNFIEKLNPVSYKFKVRQNLVTSSVIGYDESGKEITKEEKIELPGIRTHYGLIAQEVSSSLNGKDFAGFIYDKDTDSYGLRYDEFISPLIKAVQELSARVKELEQKLSSSV
jgi:hypothetical protein